MSNDLISRKDLLGTERLLMTDIVENNKVARYILEQVLHDIEHAPVAFDKEKVIEKLKDQYNYSRKVRNKNDNDYFEYWDGRTDSYKDAIEIVEKGGIE